MLKEERFEIILKKLEKANSVTYEDLASLIPVSEDTIRRDIDYLYRNGLLSKVRGGAMLRSKDPLSFNERSNFLTNEKAIIALKAQKFIKDGMTVFMDGGTTVCAVAEHFPSNIPLRVITNNLQLIPILTQFASVEICVLGGEYHQDTGTTMGTETCLEACRYIADVFFMGICAIDHELGISAVIKGDSEVKRSMISTSRKVIALAGKNKLRRIEPFKVSDIMTIDVLITDLASNDQELEDFRNLGIQIV